LGAQAVSDDELLVLHESTAACLPELVPGEPVPPVAETIAFYRHPPSTHERHHWVAADAGFCSLYAHSPSATYVHLFVHPERRREGIGTTLLGAALAKARELGLASVLGWYATPVGAAFADHFDAVAAQRDVRSLLDLHAARLPEPQPRPGWRLVTWLGRVPDEHAESYARARAAMDDAPSPDGFALPAESVERIRA